MVLTEVADFPGILAMDTTPAAAVASSPANFRQVKLPVTLGDGLRWDRLAQLGEKR